MSHDLGQLPVSFALQQSAKVKNTPSSKISILAMARGINNKNNGQEKKR